MKEEGVRDPLDDDIGDLDGETVTDELIDIW